MTVKLIAMVKFRVIKVSDAWSTNALIRKVEKELEKIHAEGSEIINVSFGYNMWFIPTAFISLKR